MRQQDVKFKREVVGPNMKIQSFGLCDIEPVKVDDKENLDNTITVGRQFHPQLIVPAIL